MFLLILIYFAYQSRHLHIHEYQGTTPWVHIARTYSLYEPSVVGLVCCTAPYPLMNFRLRLLFLNP